ncbi:MAG: M16 family metallopeptidase [Acidimicrobiales bacterium]
MKRSRIPLVELRLAFPLPAAQIRRGAEPLVMSESMLAGTGRHDRASLADAVGRLGGAIGVTVTGDCLILHASALAPRLGRLLSLVAEVLTSASYAADEVSSDRRRSADEVRLALSLPETMAGEALARRLWGRHPYGAAMPRPEVVERVGAARLRQLHSTVLRPAAGCLVVVGDVQPTRALANTEEALGSWLETKPAESQSLPPLPNVMQGPIQLVDRPGAIQSNIRIGGRMPSRSREDWPAAAMANAVLGGMFTSRLVENLRERNGYTYSPFSKVTHLRAGSGLRVGADVSTGVTAPALVEMTYEIARLASCGVTTDELELARRYLTGVFLFATSTQVGLVSTLAILAVAGLRPEYLARYPARLATVTKEEVDGAAARYLAPSTLATVVVGDAEVVTDPLAALGQVEVPAGDGHDPIARRTRAGRGAGG